ncbi:MAG: hypothetical protein CVV44_17815 [Spirochaetae bacterium HGW-Spirochaetae-1]|jgi:hypothetical protein|nr:MAG: hypothetical protein CVV44_17815 [Spirochaetae bacterium HGW-Spirochaetae-1]
MKNKYLISSIVSLSVALLTAFTACSPALSDRDPYADDEKTGVVTSAADLVSVLNGQMRGIVAFPQEIAGSDCDGFCGAINSVSDIYGTKYTDQQGSSFSINEDHYVEAPKDEDGYYYYNSEENMLVWFMINNNNAGRNENELWYSFPMTMTGRFILTETATVTSNFIYTLGIFTGHEFKLTGQYAGLTMGFVDKVEDGHETQQNGGILVKAVKTGSADYLILQLPDVTTALADELGFINIPHVMPDNSEFINLEEPFTVEMKILGWNDPTVNQGPIIELYCNGVRLMPLLRNGSIASTPFNGSIYNQYVSSAAIWTLMGTSSLNVWKMLWSGGTILGNEVPGCISAISGNIVLACDIGLGGTAGTSSASSSQLLGMSINYQGPIASDY